MLAELFFRCKYIVEVGIHGRLHGKVAHNTPVKMLWYRMENAPLATRRSNRLWRCFGMKKLFSVLVVLTLLCASCWAMAEDNSHPEILAIYSCPDTQIITGDI